MKGHVYADPDQPDRVFVLTESIEKPFVLERDRIIEIIQEDDAFDAYYARRDSVPATAEAQYQFGLWCDANRLRALAEAHYRRAIALDKDHLEARKKLGHVLHDGTWMTYDEQRRAQGLVQYKGRWVSQKALDRIATREESESERASWARQVEVLVLNLNSGKADESSEAERQLRAIQEAAAIPALVKALASGAPRQRIMLAQILGPIGGPEARRALMRMLLAEEAKAVRDVIVDALVQRAEPEIGPELIALLASKDTLRIGQAARALAELNVQAAVPRLIEVVMRVERRPVIVPSTESRSPLLNFTLNESIPILTGPVVAPGAVAYGATSVPFGSGVVLGSGITQSSPTMKIVTFVQRNPEVLAALQSLTGRNFGYDQAAWKRWQRTSFRAEAQPLRRVPQP